MGHCSSAPSMVVTLINCAVLTVETSPPLHEYRFHADERARAQVAD